MSIKIENTNIAIEMIENADGFGGILTMATQYGEYWFTVGWYKSIANAKRGAAKQLARLGYTFTI